MGKQRNILFYLLALGLFSFLTRLYLPSFNNPFNFDDQHAIVDNLQIRSLDNISRFFTDPRVISVLPSNQVYRPLSALSLALDYKIAGGLLPSVFHRSMYIVFCLQLLAMFFLIQKIIKKTLPQESESFVNFSALLITALYGYNTCLVETLDYTVSRSDSYSTFFAVLAVALFARGGWIRKYGFYLIPVILGALTKETGATVPALIFCYEFLVNKEGKFWSRFRSAFTATIPSLTVIVIFLCLYFWISIAAPPPGTTRLPYLVTQIYVTAHYILMFFLPVHLNADSDLRAFTDLLDERVLLAGILHIFLLCFLIKGIFSRKLSPISFGLSWFYISLLPTSSIIPIEDVQNDHRMFYPFVGLAIAVGWTGVLIYQQLIAARGVRIANIFLIAASLLYLTGHSYGITQRHQVWSSKENLWHDVTKKSPNNARGLMNYGIQLMQRADYKGARSYFLQALKIWPNYSYLHLNLAILNGAENMDVEADKEYRLANQLNPNNPTGYIFYANWLMKKGRYSEALENIDKVILLSPDYSGAKEMREAILALSKNEQSH